MKHDDVFEVASIIRQEFELQKINRIELAQLYYEYNPIDNIDLFIQRATRTFPTGNCGLASIYLNSRLQMGKVVQGKYADNNHTFIQLSDEIIVDITADQFGGPKVYVGPLIQPWST